MKTSPWSHSDRVSPVALPGTAVSMVVGAAGLGPAAHGLVAPADLEAFLQALAAQLRPLDGAEPRPSGR